MGTAFGPPFILDLKDGTTTPLLSTNVVEIRYSSGFLVYVLPNGTMEALRYDLDAKRISGVPVTIATDVSTGMGVRGSPSRSGATFIFRDSHRMESASWWTSPPWTGVTCGRRTWRMVR